MEALFMDWRFFVFQWSPLSIIAALFKISKKMTHTYQLSKSAVNDRPF